MAQLIDETITAHQTGVDLLKAIKTVNERIEKLDPNRLDYEREIGRLSRQRKILAEQYNEIIKPIRKLEFDNIEPLKLADPVFGDKVKNHLSPRCMNCLKDYFRNHHFPSKDDPTVRDLFDVEMHQFAKLRNVGVGTMDELARFVNHIRNEMMAA